MSGVMVEVARKSHSRKENGRRVSYAVGDTFMATEREVERFKGRLLPVEEAPADKLSPKEQLLADARAKGLEVEDSMTKADIQAVIDAAAAQ